MRLSKDRDYRKITDEEMNEYKRIHSLGDTGRKFGRINHYNDYPEIVKHYLSIFPNNHIFLLDEKKKNDLHTINSRFNELIHSSSLNERDILRFINHTPGAINIIGSIFTFFEVGHHDAYIFPEFMLGNEYIADYLLIGAGSGGYEFVFVELEKPNGRVTLKAKYPGEVIRSGYFQILDWKRWIDENFTQLRDFFEKEKKFDISLPNEFIKYDSTRIHYILVAGLREDYNDSLYYYRRLQEKDGGIILKHYDNLFDSSETLLGRNTF